MRLELGSGQWAELRERLSYGSAREVRLALLTAEEDRLAMADTDMALVVAYVSAWNVLSITGEAVPLDRPADAPDDVVQAIAIASLRLWNGKPDPKDMTGRTATSQPEQP